jgi:mannose-6-phosphate isomerase-like protein (cupin superfamily)
MAAGEPYVVNRADLAVDDGSPEFVGADHGGGARICLILVDARPGSGPRLHRHPYEEVFVVLEGRATYVAGERELEARAGDIVVVPAGLPHRFFNAGDGPLRQVDIHVSPRFETEWLE